MPRIQPLFALSRQLTVPLPRQATHQFARFSIATRLSTTPSRAADLAAAEALTDADSAQAPALDSSTPSTRPDAPSKPIPTAISQLPPPRYHVARTKSKNLPIYSDFKRGGNLHLTTIGKVSGDMSALKDELCAYLKKDKADVKINSLTNYVVVKGLFVPQVTEFLKARGM